MVKVYNTKAIDEDNEVSKGELLAYILAATDNAPDLRVVC
jgi:hypothetical protein